MPITSLSTLLANPTFQALARLQAKLDTVDSKITESGFTRSPLHNVAFLVMYASLPDDQRTLAIENLNGLTPDGSPRLSKPDLDVLLSSIEWEPFFEDAKSKTRGTKLTLTLPNHYPFMDNLRANSPSLADLIGANDLIKFEFYEPRDESADDDDHLKLTTEVVQDVKWETPFEDSHEGGYWQVPQAGTQHIGSSLRRTIDELRPGSHTFGSFRIEKGTAPEGYEIFIKKPRHEDAYKKESPKQVIGLGIYGCFKGLPGIFNVTALLASKATFSKEGARVEQEQEVDVDLVGSAPPGYSTPTRIYIEDVHALYADVGIEVNFGTQHPHREGPVDPEFCVVLPTQERLGFKLEPYTHTPAQALELSLNTAHEPIGYTPDSAHIDPEHTEEAEKAKAAQRAAREERETQRQTDEIARISKYLKDNGITIPEAPVSGDKRYLKQLKTAEKVVETTLQILAKLEDTSNYRFSRKKTDEKAKEIRDSLKKLTLDDLSTLPQRVSDTEKNPSAQEQKSANQKQFLASLARHAGFGGIFGRKDKAIEQKDSLHIDSKKAAASFLVMKGSLLKIKEEQDEETNAERRAVGRPTRRPRS